MPGGRGGFVGLKDWLKSQAASAEETKYFYEVGCELLGHPAGGYLGSTLAERIARVNAGRREAARRSQNMQEQKRYPAPSRDWGYYSKSSGGRIDIFIGPDGGITSERPHIHMIQNSPTDDYIFVVTDALGSHSQQYSLAASASGNQVNATIAELVKLLR